MSAPGPVLGGGGARLLSGLLAATVLSLLVTELTAEKHRLLAAPVVQAAPAPAAADAPPAAPAVAPVQRAAVPTAAPAAPRTAAAVPVAAAPVVPAGVGPVAEQPPATVPARAGTWAYAFSVDGSSERATLQVRRDDTAAVARDEQTWTAGGDVRTESHDWTASRMTTTTSNACRWSPADTSLLLPLRKGARWTSRTSCRNDDGSTTTATTSSTAKGWTKVTIGGHRVVTWVIARTVRTVVTSEKATATGSSAATDFFAPAYGLTVVESVRTTYPGPDGTPQVVDAVRRLQSTQPA